jgi:hypothetical protein
MNHVARNALQNSLGLDRTRADWLAENLTPEQAAELSDPTSTATRDEICSIASDCLKRIAAELKPAPVE